MPQPTIAHALPVPAQEAPQVTVEKSGFEEDQGLEPPPSPPPRRFGFWPWSWTRSTPAYRYLTRSVIDELPRASAAASLAIHRCSQQRHPAGQRARLRLLP